MTAKKKKEKQYNTIIGGWGVSHSIYIDTDGNVLKDNDNNILIDNRGGTIVTKPNGELDVRGGFPFPCNFDDGNDDYHCNVPEECDGCYRACFCNAYRPVKFDMEEFYEFFGSGKYKDGLNIIAEAGEIGYWDINKKYHPAIKGCREDLIQELDPDYVKDILTGKRQCTGSKEYKKIFEAAHGKIPDKQIECSHNWTCSKCGEKNLRDRKSAIE